jgi:NTE family protein
MQKTINLVLSGGGARGYVHIGVIEVLLEKGYKINSISGNSMGAIIGAMAAAGKLEEYKNWIISQSLLDIITTLKIDIKDKLSNSTISLQKVFKEMKKFTGEPNIEELGLN